VKWQGVSLGTFARKIVKHIVDNDNFYRDINLIKEGVEIAKKLVSKNIGKPLM